MKIPPIPHRWTLSAKEAIAVQRRLRSRVVLRPLPMQPRFVLGLDAAFSPDGKWCLAVAVLWDAEAKTVVEKGIARARLRFPYIPGLLSFREAPALVAAMRRIRSRVDLLMCDGHGMAHPRRFGIASHLGVVLGMPAIGCAKSRLVGESASPGERRGSKADLKEGDEMIGAVVRTRTGVRPVFVSVGNAIDLDQACAVVLRCAVGYRLPEPTRLADRRVAEVKRMLRSKPWRAVQAAAGA